jgi:glycosyltransferase involved in cell wall biosynthesis
VSTRVLQVAAKASTLAGFVLPLMERARRDGFEVEALAGLDGFEERVKAGGFVCHPWRMGHTFDPLALWGARRDLRRFLGDHSYDIVHTHCSFAGIVGNPVAFPMVPTLIYTQHGFYVHEGLGPVRRQAWLTVERIGLRHAHRLVCVSQAERALAQQLLGWGDERFLTIPGVGVRTDQFRLPAEEREGRRAAARAALGLPPEHRVLLTVSRLTWDKGYLDMIEAARVLKDEGLDFVLLAAGSGRDDAAIRAAARDAGVDDVVRFLGWRDDVADLLYAADIFVFASHREGLPISPIEAMASGLPVVASDISGCREEIEHERSGLLYPVGDAAALAEALKRVLTDPDLAARMGRQAAERAKAFDLERVLDLQMQLYKSVSKSQGS